MALNTLALNMLGDPMNAPVEPHPSACLILLRDGTDGLEVFMVQRHRDLRFAAGATVFPGGRLEPQDQDLNWRELSCPLTEDLPHRLAAVRETFEECGILLARPTPVEAGIAALREPSAQPFIERLSALGAEPATDALVPFARWITPEAVWRRFDTTFFLARAPSGQSVVVDGGEVVAGFWGTPRAILRAAETGQLSLVFATRMNLLRLAECRTVRHAMEEATRFHPLVPILPRPVETPSGPVLRIPDDAGYRVTEVPLDEVRLG
ncbi:NUDIX hydrolase [Azospirillum sp. sgz302134]